MRDLEIDDDKSADPADARRRRGGEDFPVQTALTSYFDCAQAMLSPVTPVSMRRATSSVFMSMTPM